MQTGIKNKKTGRRRNPSSQELVRAFSLAMIAMGAGGVGGLTYATQVEPAWVETTHIRLALPRLPEVFAGYRIVQISDLHIEWMGQERLANIVDTVNSLSPDLIVMTGDYVTETYDSAAVDLVPMLRLLKAPDGIMGVMGNHDYWGRAGVGVIRSALAESNVIDMNNKVHALEREGSTLHIAGLDSVREARNRLDKVLRALPAEGAAVLMVHEPDFADTAARTGRFDLQISGHSHGGQVVIPFVGPPHLPPLGRKYHTGLYKVGDMLEYTNRGLGMVGLPVRFWCRPEITVFTLEPGSNASALLPSPQPRQVARN